MVAMLIACVTVVGCQQAAPPVTTGGGSSGGGSSGGSGGGHTEAPTANVTGTLDVISGGVKDPEATATMVLGN